ncbi:hypothetical protein J4732_19030, partial [Serratia marcescens]|nr:hypothetical protein [Serratia marcescens]
MNIARVLDLMKACRRWPGAAAVGGRKPTRSSCRPVWDWRTTRRWRCYGMRSANRSAAADAAAFGARHALHQALRRRFRSWAAFSCGDSVLRAECEARPRHRPAYTPQPRRYSAAGTAGGA